MGSPADYVTTRLHHRVVYTVRAKKIAPDLFKYRESTDDGRPDRCQTSGGTDLGRADDGRNLRVAP